MNEEEFFGVELQKAPWLISAPREHEPLTLASHLSASALPPLSFCTLVGNQEPPAPDPSPCWGLQQVSSHLLGLVHPVLWPLPQDEITSLEEKLKSYSIPHSICFLRSSLCLSLSSLLRSLLLSQCVCVGGFLSSSLETPHPLK